MADITLYQFPPVPDCESASPFCVKVQRILNYKGLPYRCENLQRPPSRSLSATGKLPVLSYNGKLIPDSSDIARFIESEHPRPVLIPDDAALQARCKLLEDWADEALYWYVVHARWVIDDNRRRTVQAFFASLPSPLRLVVASIIRRKILTALRSQGIGRKTREVIFQELRERLGHIETLVPDHAFIVGENLTLADIAVFAQVDGLLTSLTPETKTEVESRPCLLAWYRRVDDLTRNPKTSPNR
jgi:glutathione S-transferase